MALLPSEIPTGLVTGQFYFVNEDNSDAGTDPDLMVVTGSVTFTCSAGVLRMPSKLATVIPMSFDAEFNSSGQLVPKGRTEVGIKLPATDSALFNPTAFTWKVSFDLREAVSGYTVILPTFDIQVPESGTIDLTTVMPVDTSPGTITIQGPVGPAGAQLYRGIIPLNQDFNDFTSQSNHSGLWSTSGANLSSYLNAPKDLAGNNISGSLLVAVSASGVRHIFYPATDNRTVERNSTNLSTKVYKSWQWVRANRGEVPASTNINTWTTPDFEGEWEVNSQTRADTLTGLPTGFVNPGRLRVSVTSLGIVEHTWLTYGGLAAIHWRPSESVGSGTLKPWTRMDPVAGDPLEITQAGIRHTALREAFVKRRGGKIGTNGKAAVAFRFDDPVNGMISNVLPMLRTYSIPATCVHVSKTFEDPTILAQSNLGSWAGIESWALNDGIEAAHHGGNHQDASTLTTLTREIVTSMVDLQASLPKQAIEWWVQPGVGGTNYAGAAALNTPEIFSQSIAGRLILGSHAISSGAMQGYVRPMDGISKNGQNHWTVDLSANLTAAYSIIQNAQDVGGSVNIMLHPYELTNGGTYTTPAEFEAFLAWCAAERDAGRLEILTMSGLAVADVTTAWRANIVRNGKFDNGLTGWVGTTGYSVTSGYATTTTGTLLKQSFLLDRFGWGKGGVWELVADFTTPTGASVTLAIADADTPANLNNSKTFTLPASSTATTRRIHSTIPLINTNTITLSVGRASGGEVRVDNVRFQPV